MLQSKGPGSRRGRGSAVSLILSLPRTDLGYPADGVDRKDA